jgi:hypothetical protein
MRYNGAVRVAACAALVLVLAGCGDGVDAELDWGRPPEVQPSGVVSTEGFSAFQREVDEEWERSPALAAGIFLRLDERRVARTTIDAVVVTLDGLADDSVRTERWTLGFEEGEDGVYALTGALRELRCHEGRGHQEFAGDPCI